MKKKSKGLSNFIVFLVVILAVSSVVYAYRTFSTDPVEEDIERIQGLNTKNYDEAAKIYNRIMSYDLDKIYPQTAEEVMKLYNNTVFMLYNDMIIDPELAKQVLQQQRKLCSDELIGNLGLDEQFINLLASTDILKEDGVLCLEISEKVIKFDQEDKHLCTISVENTFTKGLKVYRNYILYYNDSKNRWEVYSWNQTDENFK